MSATQDKRYQVVGLGEITHANPFDLDWKHNSYDNLNDAEKYILQRKSSNSSFPIGLAIIDFGEYFTPNPKGKIIYIDYRDYCLKK